MDKRWNYGEHQLRVLGGWGCYASVTSNYVDLFGMANGLPIIGSPADTAGCGYNPNNPWVNRDPRFYYSIVKDGDRQILNTNNPDTYVQFFQGGRHCKDIGSGISITFGHKKFKDITCNGNDPSWRQYFFECPHMRLAEVYIDYAEAVNEAYGPTTVPPGIANAPTAAEALNIVRRRVEISPGVPLPDVDPRFLTKEKFREIVRQEKAVELCFEGHRWNDVRRWHIAPQCRKKFILEFDKDHTYFKKVEYRTSIFEEKHYWLPFTVDQVTLYPDFKQNPGW
jgi:hypothetical protein